MSDLDFRTVPRLYHLDVAGRHFCGVTFDAYPALQEYFNRFKEQEAWKATLYEPESMITGWGNKRK